jgi:molecular chaperone DnaK (HSP70)
VILTVPASFDPAARELTAEAARTAGFENLVLLEEPQAAFYNWIQRLGVAWRKHVRVGDVVLVIDVGGHIGSTSCLIRSCCGAPGSMPSVLFKF